MVSRMKMNLWKYVLEQAADQRQRMYGSGILRNT